MPQFTRDARRWIRHFRNLQTVQTVFPTGSADASSPRLVAPWLSDTVQLNFPILPRIGRSLIATPVAGAEWSVTVPDSESWKIISIHFLLTTDVNVANRIVRVEIVDTVGGVVFHALPNDLQTASLTRATSVAAYGALPILASPLFSEINIPPGLWVRNSFQIRSRTLNIQAGDQYSAIRIYIEAWPGNAGA